MLSKPLRPLDLTAPPSRQLDTETSQKWYNLRVDKTYTVRLNQLGLDRLEDFLTETGHQSSHTPDTAKVKVQITWGGAR